MTIVIDSSYALACLMPDEGRPVDMDHVLSDVLIAPFIWPLEIANVLRSALRQGRMGRDQAANVARHAVNLDLRITPPWHDEPLRYLDLSLTHELTPYDAIYLELALAQHAALATRDRSLAAAAQRLGVTVHH